MKPLTPAEKTACACLVTLQVVVRIALIVHAGPMTDQGLYVDDAYMSHKLAQNIAEHRGITQAGEPTNGFQPLFVFLLVPVYLLFDPLHATVVSGILSAGFSVAGGLLLFSLLRQLFDARVGLCGLGLWTLSPHLTRTAFNGLETSLALMLMLAVVVLALKTTRRIRRFGAGKAAGFGVVSGLALLARLDLGLLFAWLVVHQYGARRRRGETGAYWTFLVASMCVVLPWFAWSRAVCGRWTPVSGAATRTISQLYADPSGPVRGEPAYFPLDEPPTSFYSGQAIGAVRRIVLDLPLNAATAAWKSHRLVASIVVPMAWLIAAWLLHGRLPRHHPRAGRLRRCLVDLWFAWAFALSLVAAYVFYFFGQWNFERYLAPIAVLAIVPCALWTETVLSWLMKRRALGVASIGLLSGPYVAGSFAGHAELFRLPRRFTNEHRMYHDTVEIFAGLPADARIGTFESGIMDYFTGVDVYNLDGKTNARAHEAMIQGRMDELIDSLGIDYVVSSPPLIRDLLLGRGRWEGREIEFVRQLRHNGIIRVHPAKP